MAELGETSDPKALVPGDPAAIDGNVAAMRGRGDSMELVGVSLKGIDTGDYWQGDAAESFRNVFTQEPPRWFAAADSFHAAADELSAFAGTLRWAQGQAQEAIHTWDKAEAATNKAVSDYNTAVTNANRVNAVNAAADNPVRVSVAPFVDPGEEGRARAREMLTSARAQLKGAGDAGAATIKSATQAAPEKPKSRSAFDNVKEFGGGIWDSVKGYGELIQKFGPQRMQSDPLGFGKDAFGLAKGLGGAASDPKEFGKQLLDWDTWANNPSRAAGRLVPDALGAAATGGGSAVAKKAGASVAEEAAEAAASKTATSVAKGPVLDQFKYKDTWGAADRADMDRKLSSFNDAVGDKGFSQVRDVPPRVPAIRQQFLDSLGLDKVPPGTHVDHTLDLQAGGTDTVDNMQLMRASPNTSFGSQLQHQMSQHPPDTVFPAVEMLRGDP